MTLLHSYNKLVIIQSVLINATHNKNRKVDYRIWRLTLHYLSLPPLWFPPPRLLQSSTMGGRSAGRLRYCWYSLSSDVNLLANISSLLCRVSVVSAMLIIQTKSYVSNGYQNKANNIVNTTRCYSGYVFSMSCFCFASRQIPHAEQ